MKEGIYQMKTSVRRTLCTITAAAVAASALMLTGCGQNKPASQSGNVSVSDEKVQAALAYKSQEITPKKSIDSGAVYKNGLFYATHYQTQTIDEKTINRLSIVVFDESGEVKNEFPVGESSPDAGEYISISGYLSVDDSGNITFLRTMDTMSGTSESAMITLGPDGSTISEQDMSSLISSTEYVMNWVKDDEGYIYINTGSGIKAFDKDMNKAFEIKPENATFLSSVFLTNDGKPAFNYITIEGDSNHGIIAVIDKQAQNIEKKINIASDKTWGMQSGGGEYICYCNGDTGILGVREDGSFDTVLDLLTIGVDNTSINGFCTDENGVFYFSVLDYVLNKSGVVKVYPVDKSEIKEKTVITLGCFTTDWSVRSQIAEFNKNNDDYTIYVNSYSDSNDTTDYSAAITTFNNEMLAGKVPDILLINDEMPYESYEAKGLFTDLYEYIDKDPDISKDSFQPNVLEALESNGKLYKLCTAYAVRTFVTKNEHMHGDILTLMDAAAEAKNMGENIPILGYTDRSKFLKNGIEFSDFIDYRTKTCNFENEDFKTLLEVSKSLPETVDLRKLSDEDPDFYTNYSMGFVNDQCLMYELRLDDYANYDWIRPSIGQDYAITGFPSDKFVTKGVIDPTMMVAVSNTSPNKDGAWTFIKYCLNNDVVEEPYTYIDNDGNVVETTDMKYYTRTSSLPVLKEHFEKLSSHALDTKYDYNPDGTKEVQKNEVWTATGSIILPPLSQQEFDQIYSTLTTSNRLEFTNSDIFNIIKDEAANYYAGTKSLDETVSLIQNRVNLYMSEHY